MTRLDADGEAVRPMPPPAGSYVEDLFRARYLEMVRLAGLLGADDPEDIAQEAFVRLMNRPPQTGDPQGALPLADDPPDSAILALRVSPPATGPVSPTAPQAVTAFSWLAYTSSSSWRGQLQGRQFCDDAVYPNGGSSGFCVPLPRLGAGRLASVTASTDFGPVVLQGAAASRVTSVTAVLPGGRTVKGVVKTGRGFPYNAWAVAYPQAKGVRLVFRDASGAVVASLGTAAPLGPPQVPQPGSGGIVAFTVPRVPGANPAGTVLAYLIDGYVGFWNGPGSGLMAPSLASGPPALAGLSQPFSAPNRSEQSPAAPPSGAPGANRPRPAVVWKAFGYAHANVARVVLRLPNGQHVSTSTFAAWPGSGLRLWAVGLPVNVLFDSRGVPAITATGYDAAGNVVAHVTLGSTG